MLDKERSKRKKEKKMLPLARSKFFQYVNDIMEDLFWSEECHAQVLSYFKRT